MRMTLNLLKTTERSKRGDVARDFGRVTIMLGGMFQVDIFYVIGGTTILAKMNRLRCRSA